MTPAEALEISNNAFPKGPEAVAEALQADVSYTPLVGCEGWCLQHLNRIVIVINSSSSVARQRFTLAHELAHVLLGTPAGVVKSDPFESDDIEERAADELAGALLLPESRVKSMIGGRLPIDADTLVRIAKAANVSPTMVACSVVESSKSVLQGNAAVVFFDSAGKYRSRYSRGLEFPNSTAERLVQQVSSNTSPGIPIRIPRNDGKVVFASAIDGWQYYKALFVQLLSQEESAGRSSAEQIAHLQSVVFQGDRSFEGSVTSCAGHIRNKLRDKTVSEALQAFDDKYLQKPSWNDEQKARLMSPDGRELLRWELSKSCLPDV
jgi:hypothetical protein